MTADSDTKGGQEITVEVVIADDRRSAVLQFKKEDQTVCVTAADTASVEILLIHLGGARNQMLDEVPRDLPEGVLPLAAYDPNWRIRPDTTNKFATFWIRHPGLGWSGYGFPRHEAGNIAKWLRKVTTFTSTHDAQSSSATTFGDDKFLLSTEGLGFYYYGEGESRIGPNPFEQIEFDSDRAAGIVAGAIAERRLEQALRSRLRTDVPAISGTNPRVKKVSQ